jgi:hypothetical protein
MFYLCPLFTTCFSPFIPSLHSHSSLPLFTPPLNFLYSFFRIPSHYSLSLLHLPTPSPVSPRWVFQGPLPSSWRLLEPSWSSTVCPWKISKSRKKVHFLLSVCSLCALCVRMCFILTHVRWDRITWKVCDHSKYGAEKLDSMYE